jgi:protein-disulfide isomerase
VTRRRSLLFAGVLAAAAAIVVVAIVVSQSGETETAPVDERAALFDGIPQDGPWLGQPDAPVVVEEYVDLQCPFCAQYALSELPNLVEQEVRTGRARLRLRIVSILGPDSEKAAAMGAAARQQDRGWQFAEAFFAEQGTENSGYVTDVFLRERAEEAGLDVERALRERNLEPVERALAADARAFERAELGGTPSFRVGPRGATLSNVEATQVRSAIAAAADDS